MTTEINSVTFSMKIIANYIQEYTLTTEFNNGKFREQIVVAVVVYKYNHLSTEEAAARAAVVTPQPVAMDVTQQQERNLPAHPQVPVHMKHVLSSH